MGRLELSPDVAFVVLATDGLWDVLSDQDAVDIGLAALAARQRAGEGAATDRAARALAGNLVNTALLRGSSDNITAVVLLPAWNAAQS